MSPGAIRTTISEAVAAFVRENAVLVSRFPRTSLVASSDPAARTVLRSVEAGSWAAAPAAVRRPARQGRRRGKRDAIGRCAAAFVPRLAAAVADGFTSAMVAHPVGHPGVSCPQAGGGRPAGARSSRQCQGWGRWMFRRADNEAFVAALEGSAPAVVGPNPVHMGFETAVEALRRRSIRITDVLRAAIGGTETDGPLSATAR